MILGCSRYQLFQLPVNFMESFLSTVELFYMGLQILVVSWMHLFYSKVFLGDTVITNARNLVH